MFIKKIRLQSFGRLTGTCEFQRGQCNIVCQDNEFGKTTLMDAVLYGLYDFPSGGKRIELKPKDRYRPWNKGKADGFVVELDIVTGDERELRLRADFARQNPFELTDMQTWQKLPMDGSFGQRYFRMPLQSFTGCFFYRQDEAQTNGRDELIRVIEEAAASNQRQQPSSVRQAISALSDAKVHLPEFSVDAIQVETLLKRIDEKIERVRRQIAELEEEKTRRAGDIDAAGSMDSDIRELEQERLRLEHAVILAELFELESNLRRHEEAAAAVATREARLAELQPYAAFDPGKRSQVQSLLAEWRTVGNRVEESQQRIESELRPKLAEVESNISSLPSAAATFSAEQLEQLRTWKSQLADRREQAAAERRRADSMESELRGRGVPVEELDSALERLEQLSEGERQVILDPLSARSDAEASLSDLERRAAEARATLAQAKSQRNQLRTFAGGAALFAIAFLVCGIVLILANFVFAGSGMIAIAALGGGLGLVYLSKLQREVVKTQLEPAAAAEVSLNGETQKLRESVTELRTELEDVCTRHQLGEEDVKRLKAATQWLQMAGPYQSARDAAIRLSAEAATIQQQATPAVRELLQLAAATEINETELERAATLLARYHELTESLAKTQAELAALDKQTAEFAADRDAKREALIANLQPALASVEQYDSAAELEALVNAFDAGCEQAIRLQTLEAEAQSQQPLSSAELAQFIGRTELLQFQLDALQQESPRLANATLDPRPRASIQDELSAIERRREEMRVRRTDLFNDCDRAVEAWRHEGPKLQEELDRLTAVRDQAREFGLAVSLAYRELSDIADQVFRQWATAINERVNEVLPLINPKYKDVACSNELELSAYSDEVGRRLDGRELQHLSKGARDQLQMALRIAVSEYLSAHVGNLPLVFDEPFAHWDDARFVEGMRFLANLTERHQVILLSCHNWRYDQLRKTHPELAERLHFCSLCDDAQKPEAAPAGAFL